MSERRIGVSRKKLDEGLNVSGHSSEEPEDVESEFIVALCEHSMIERDGKDHLRFFVDDIMEDIIGSMESKVDAVWGEAEWERLSEALAEVAIDLENLLPTIKVWAPKMKERSS